MRLVVQRGQRRVEGERVRVEQLAHVARRQPAPRGVGSSVCVPVEPYLRRGEVPKEGAAAVGGHDVGGLQCQGAFVETQRVPPRSVGCGRPVHASVLGVEGDELGMKRSKYRTHYITDRTSGSS